MCMEGVEIQSLKTTAPRNYATAGSIYFVINEIFISQTFYLVTVLKKVKRCKNEGLKTRVCDLSFAILKMLLSTALLRLIIG